MDKTEEIRKYLKENSVTYKEVDHDVAPTCELSAKFRGESIEIGGKTLLFKDKWGYRLFVISAALQVDSNKVRKILGSQRLRFATEDELMAKCSVVKGALPPFGRPLQDFDLYIDESIFQNELIAFNAGILTKSFILKIEDYKKLVNPNICNFSKD
ncbi:YbaK/EbsC family protein [Halobacteriovorax sp.]|uniref:YbaK/EbsC family protein n=1 Tax=Halobacteriovorax sp. TaxID=2020862 RepID=UPI003563DC0C